MKTLFVLFFVSLFAYAQVPLAKGYPKWLKSGEYYPEQTSGITLISSNEKEQQFLLADDIGKIHRMVVTGDSGFVFHPVKIIGEAEQVIATLPKKDFEEIVYDRFADKVYLSIEGNGPDCRNIAGVFELQFASHSLYSDTIIAMKRLEIAPAEEVKKYVANNVGYEGVAVDSKALYLGLEGFQNEDTFADSTYIYIIDKASLHLKAAISTKPFGIHTVCGLYAVADRSLLVLDRNNRKIHYLEFNTDYTVVRHFAHYVKPAIPGFEQFEYNMAIESLSADGQGNLYVIDDPWKSRYKPEEMVYSQINEETRKNFGKFVPIIYKFTISPFTKE